MQKEFVVLLDLELGKTYSIKERVKRILGENNKNRYKIFAVTFTRAAAEQLREELCGMSEAARRNVTASTLHSYVFKILQQEQAINALGRHVRPCF